MATPSTPGGSNKEAPRAAPNVWSFFVIVIVVAGVFAITWLVLVETTDNSEAAGILGVVVPVFASIGAAVFGVAVGYQAGTKVGEDKGKEKAANAMAPKVDSLATSATPVIQSSLNTQAGSNEQAASVQQALGELRGTLDGLRA